MNIRSLFGSSRVRTQLTQQVKKGGEIGSAEEVSGQLVVSGGNAAPVLEATPCALDAVAILEADIFLYAGSVGFRSNSPVAARCR